MRQRARATLPTRRRTSHGTVSAALQLLLVQQPLWEPRTDTETGHGGHVRVTHNTRRDVASELTVGWDGLSWFGDGARRRTATAGGGAEASVVWTPRSLRLLAAVSHRVL
jgi:hypothetical protein